MAIEPVTSVITIEKNYGRGVGNLTIEDAKFFGRPNFSGEMDRFKDDRRKFTVLIPNEMADELRAIGWNVKTSVPEEGSEQEPISHMKVMVDFRWDEKHPGDVEYEKGPDIWVMQNENREKLNSKTAPILDRSRLEHLDIEVRGWEYDADENPGMLSARLVTLVAVRRPNTLGDKYGGLI